MSIEELNLFIVMGKTEEAWLAFRLLIIEGLQRGCVTEMFVCELANILGKKVESVIVKDSEVILRFVGDKFYYRFTDSNQEVIDLYPKDLEFTPI